MLQITVPEREYFDEETYRFFKREEKTLELEHSLVSLSKWESKWHKPFFTKHQKTFEETVDYIKCMTLTPNVDPEVYSRLSRDNFKEIEDYLEDSMTATTFPKDVGGKKNNEQVTAELIYYWMTALAVPYECENWHLNKLITLIRVCNVKNQPPKKMSRREIMARNDALNEANKRRFNSKG